MQQRPLTVCGWLLAGIGVFGAVVSAIFMSPAGDAQPATSVWPWCAPFLGLVAVGFILVRYDVRRSERRSKESEVRFRKAESTLRGALSMVRSINTDSESISLVDLRSIVDTKMNPGVAEVALAESALREQLSGDAFANWTRHFTEARRNIQGAVLAAADNNAEGSWDFLAEAERHLGEAHRILSSSDNGQALPRESEVPQ